jgi:hypothetical protein
VKLKCGQACTAGIAGTAMHMVKKKSISKKYPTGLGIRPAMDHDDCLTSIIIDKYIDFLSMEGLDILRA